MAFPALYTALRAETSLGELVRHITPELLPFLNGFRLSELSVALSRVIDCLDSSVVGLGADLLTSDANLEHTRAIGTAAHSLGFEGLLVPSATLLGDNLVLLPDNFSPSTRIEVLSSRDPRLFIER